MLARKTAKRLEKVNQDITYAIQGPAIGCSILHGYFNVLIENKLAHSGKLLGEIDKKNNQWPCITLFLGLFLKFLR